MKKFMLTIFALASILFLACANNSGSKTKESVQNQEVSEKNNLKRYNVKSGMVKYKITTTGKVMGGEVSGSGTKELYFDNWGAKELNREDSKQVTKINIFGQKKTDISEVHTINKLENGKSYSVDTKNKIIYVKQDPAMEMVKMFNNGDANEVGEQMMESMGGKKIGTGKVLGYDCDIWEIPGGKQWIYKGVPLKIDVQLLGIRRVEEAQNAKFNLNVPQKYFELPNYPVQEIDMGFSMGMTKEEQAEMKQSARKMANMSYKEYKQMLMEEDPEAAQMSEEDIKKSYEMMKKMAQAMGN